MYKRRRSSKKADEALFGMLILFALIGALVSLIESAIAHISQFLLTDHGKVCVGLAFFAVTFSIINRIRNKIRLSKEHAAQLALDAENHNLLQQSIGKITPSTNRFDYLIEKDDYRRGNKKENFYRKTFLLQLIRTFNNCCAKCESTENGIDVDHFIFSKNEGGNFILKHKDGYLVNNAIPLCQSCNRSKSDKSFKYFFSDEELLSIFEKNLLMTKTLNAREIFCEEGNLIKLKRSANN